MTISKLNDVFRRVFENNKIQISENTSAKDIEKWDSLNHFVLISEIEKTFQLNFELDELLEFKNVGDIIRAIDKKSNGA